MILLNSPLFYVSNKDTYPPFKNGLYLEEYFFLYMKNNNKVYNKEGKLYLPILWTNFQIEGWFTSKKEEMQNILNSYILNNYCEKGYFTVVQYDDGPLLQLPKNTIIYGACSGNIQLPLIYQDIENKLENIQKLSFSEKTILCSFVGMSTNILRNIMIERLTNKSNFSLLVNSCWTANVEKHKQDNFIGVTISSKFALAPRGYGRSSFRFFEVFKLGTIPIYIWDDIEWLPYKDILDYSKFCISIHISEIDSLESRLLSIDETKYNNMMNEYKKVKHYFELDYMCEYICLNTF